MENKNATLYRSKSDRMFGGVVSAFAGRLGVDVPLARFAFAATCLVIPQLVIAYVAALLIIPEEGQASPPIMSRASGATSEQASDDA